MLATYNAVYRLASRPYALSNVFGGAGRKQFATIGHAATARKWVRLRHVWVALESNSAAAAIVMAELVRLTDNAAASGNPAITPIRAMANELGGDAIPAAEATCLALPTTPGTEEAGPFNMTEFNLGTTGAASVANPPPDLTWRDLLDLASNGLSREDYDVERANPVIPAATAAGWAVAVDASAATTVKGYVIISFTEE